MFALGSVKQNMHMGIWHQNHHDAAFAVGQANCPNKATEQKGVIVQ